MVDTTSLHLFAKRDKVWLFTFLQSPVFVSPELSCRSNTSLNLVDDKVCSVLFGNLSKLSEVGRRGMLITSFGQDGLDNDRSDGSCGFAEISACLYAAQGRVNSPINQDLLILLQTLSLLLLILLDMLFERILELREWSDWPVESGDIDLVDSL